MEEFREVEGQYQNGEAQNRGGVRQDHAVGHGVGDRGLDLAVPLRVCVVRPGPHRTRGVVQRGDELPGGDCAEFLS
eukprot:2007886-Pleurochrysis_carterae.AAC.1